MRNTSTVNELDVANNQKINAYYNLNREFDASRENDPLSELLAEEDGENFSKYLTELGLAYDPHIVILASHHHYYYDTDEMRQVKTLINVRELNHVKELKNFLHSISGLLPQNSNFIGCFTDNRKVSIFEAGSGSSYGDKRAHYESVRQNGHVSKMPFVNIIYSFMDSRTSRYLSARGVSTYLEENGFTVVDMKERDGLTYFHAKKRK